MKASNLQSLKVTNAQEITDSHKRVKTLRESAAYYYEMARSDAKEARKLTAKIKKLAANQVAIKNDIKGPPKKAKVKKPDSRTALVVPVWQEVAA